MRVWGLDTENGVNNVTGSSKSPFEVVGEGHIQFLQLRCQALVQFIRASFGIVDCRLIAVMPEMARCYKAIASYKDIVRRES